MSAFNAIHPMQCNVFYNLANQLISVRPPKWEERREASVLVVLLTGSPDTCLGGVEGPSSVSRAKAQVVVVLLTLAAEAGLAGLQAAPAASTATEGGARVEGVASSSEPSTTLTSVVLVVLLAESSYASLDWVEASCS